MKALILSGSNNIFQTQDDKGQIRTCTIKGKILEQELKQHNPLAPGDFVEIEVDLHDKTEAQIISQLPRKNYFARKNEKTLKPRVLAANIDLVLCLTTPNHPVFRPVFVDRVLVQAASQNIPVIIVLNKTDLPLSHLVNERIDNWQNLGFTVLKTSAIKKININKIINYIKGKTVCLVGQSGVGKSSLLNAIDPNLKITTGSISEKYNKGSHTTTQGILYKIENLSLSIIDTPGMKNFSLYGIEADEVALYFPEMRTAIGKCKFGLSCSHLIEEGCEIQKRLASGKISKMRFESWLNMI